MGEILFPNEELIDTKYFNAHQDWETPIRGFFIIASKRKIKSIEEFSKEESEEFLELLIRIRRGIREILGIKKVYLFQNEDSKYNFHIGIFPYHCWMEKFGKVSGSIRNIMKYAEENLVTEENILEIKKAVKLMKEYLKDETS
jgi:diadenosine tetraphosphate (Ap4A) HIT family hydrolase